MVYILFDNPADKQNMTFLREHEALTVRHVYPSQKCDAIKRMIVACMECIQQSAKDDTIVCWYDFMAVLCWWLCRLQGKKRKIIALNILLKDKNTTKNKLAKFLYGSALKSNKVQATVTSRMYGEHLNQLLGIHKDYTLLHDRYHEGYRIDYHGKAVSNTVFCGGRNGRDWDFLIGIAQSMPQVTFNCVMPADKYEQYKDSFTGNIVVKFDIPEREFLELMCQSSLVVMPLDTEAPAGLIVFFQAAANGRMSITSDTVTTREYFSDGRGAVCGKNVEDWKGKIQYYLDHTAEAERCAARFKCFLETECSEEKYAQTLWGMLMQ